MRKSRLVMATTSALWRLDRINAQARREVRSMLVGLHGVGQVPALRDRLVLRALYRLEVLRFALEDTGLPVIDDIVQLEAHLCRFASPPVRMGVA
jgi:hypothetical protein